jgi:hypothetical protein
LDSTIKPDYPPLRAVRARSPGGATTCLGLTNCGASTWVDGPQILERLTRDEHRGRLFFFFERSCSAAALLRAKDSNLSQTDIKNALRNHIRRTPRSMGRR